MDRLRKAELAAGGDKRVVSSFSVDEDDLEEDENDPDVFDRDGQTIVV